MGKENSLRYRPEIDGLRAFAVIPVLLFHAGMGFSGGYAGVDVFFVISGYLIGTLILKEAEAGTFSFKRFWGRRLRRLFPAWAAVVILTTVAALFWLIPTHLLDYGKSLIAQPLLVANFYFWRQSGYFETASEFQPLLHTWSLAVEEQFYLFLPLILLPFARMGRRIVGFLVILFIAISLGFSFYQSTRDVSFAFFLLPARIFELDLGVILAWYLLKKKEAPRYGSGIALCGLALIFVSYFLFDENTVFPGVAALLPCLGAAAFIYGNSGMLTVSGKWLSNSFLVWIGKISYPLYLWHWPVLVFIGYLRLGDLDIVWGCLGLVLSVLLAWLTYAFIETPVRTKKAFSGLKALTTTAVVFSLGVILLGLFFTQSKGVPIRFSEEVNSLLIEPSEENDSLRLHRIDEWDVSGGPKILGDQSSDAPALLLWGDSHSAALKPVMDELGREYGVRVLSAQQPGIMPVPNVYPKGRLDIAGNVTPKVEEYIKEHDLKNILLVARWPHYVFGDGPGDMRRLLQEVGNSADSVEEGSDIFVRNLAASVQQLEAEGRKVWFMRSVGEHSRSVPETLAQIASRGGSLNYLAQPLVEHRKEDQPMNDLIDQALTGTKAQVLDPRPLFTDENGIYLMAREGKPLYRDRNHVSEFGAMQLKALFEPMFKAIGGTKNL